VDLQPVEDMRILGYRLDRRLSWSCHVDYWLRRGLQVRNRISAVTRRFGDSGGAGACEAFRLIQGAYLPTVYDGLEFVGDHKDLIKRIQIHVNDTFWHVFRLPSPLAINILLAEFGVPPVHLQARYLQRRCYSRFLSYRYCGDMPWFGSVWNDWIEPGITGEVVDSDVVINDIPTCLIVQDKELALTHHGVLWDQNLDTDRHVFYTDGSSSGGRSGAGYVCYERGLRVDPVSIRLPGDWCALECEIYALLRALASVDDLSEITGFMDCLPVIEMVGKLWDVRRNAAFANLFAPILNRIGPVTLVWIPGYRGVGGNVVADQAATDGCFRAVDGVAGEGVAMNVRNDAIAKELRKDEWLAWHAQEGHDYYRRLPAKPRHLRGLLRWDVYILVRLRSGAGSRVGHELCDRSQDRFHVSRCQLLQDGRPASDSLFDDKVVHEWRDWCERHDHLGMHVVRHKSSIDGVTVVRGNPFDDGIRISVGGGPTIPARFIKPAVQCNSCGKTSMGVHRCRHDRPRRGRLDFVPLGFRGSCYVSGVVMSKAKGEAAFRAGIGSHLNGSERCLRVWRGHELLKVFGRFADMSSLDARMTVLYHIPVGTLRCVCGKLFMSGGALSRHVEEDESSLLVWRTRYLRDMEVLEGEILRERVNLDPASHMILASQEDTLIREGTGEPERP